MIQQVSGVNTVMYYGTILLEKIGMGERGSLYANILIGLASVLACIFGSRMIANHNHLKMLKIGLTGNAIFLALLGVIMHARHVATGSYKYFGSNNACPIFSEPSRYR